MQHWISARWSGVATIRCYKMALLCYACICVPLNPSLTHEVGFQCCVFLCIELCGFWIQVWISLLFLIKRFIGTLRGAGGGGVGGLNAHNKDLIRPTFGSIVPYPPPPFPPKGPRERSYSRIQSLQTPQTMVDCLCCRVLCPELSTLHNRRAECGRSGHPPPHPPPKHSGAEEQH